ncbi:MAG: hypothetical protein ETSY1_18805 [Candidatus Entotheonella factor]|uniref:asparagine synthase (glutamine-hydrolyzing) n=1 Tax=Entotheonella factor TaxID=1429438 RepID=W4LKC8_ENTF1|nr:MAG: hypothetical protein ETSY1_18805 [Candidatus Entotheonella factor]
MCGISGLYEYRDQRPADAHLLAGMLNDLQHRGPDDTGVHIDGALGIGNRRLSIIDVAGGQQPMANEDGQVVVVSNGEIYNFRELSARLRQRGHRFQTVCDTEVLVHLYEEDGPACVEALRGMFAFAIWDAKQRQLFLARDRLGIKPLYYFDDGQRLIFASEIKAILRHPDVSVALNPQALSYFLSLKYVPAPETMFADIRLLPPGHTLICDRHGVRTQPYWDLVFPETRGPQRSEAAYAEELEALLRESVRLRLMSDVPFGAFLSGGVDSSTIVALMSQMLDKPVKTFAVGFDGPAAGASELPFARMVADHYQADHHEVFIRAQDLINLAETVVWHQDQPIADEACLANYMVAHLASQHVKMVLTGEGGDELFAGYARYAWERLSPVFSRLPRAAKSLALAASQRLPGLRRPKLALYALCQADEAARMSNWFPLCNTRLKPALLSDEMRQSVPLGMTEAWFAKLLDQTSATTPLNRMLYVDTKHWLPDDLLARGDKMSMAASLEARVPLLDHQLAEFAAALPPHLKLRGLTRKYLLKKVCEPWLPPQIIRRKKQGFPIPMSEWFRGEARAFLRDHLSPATIRRRGLLNPDTVETVLQQHDSGFADYGSLLWGLLNLELWHRVFLDRPPAAPAPPVLRA